jgi:hypothetical protein
MRHATEGNMSRTIPIALAVVMLVSSGRAQTVLKTEPPMGALREGETVLVDDGTCPKGKIKLVVGGNHVKAGGTKNIIRTRSCVAR